MRVLWVCLLMLGFAIPLRADDPPRPKPMPAVPRRIMGVCVCEYLYLNPANYGDPRSPMKVDFGSMLHRLAAYLRVPERQLIEWSDAAPGERRRPTVKYALEDAIAQFLDGSRRQDRIVLVFSGHAIEIGGEAYLVPFDGDPKVAATLIPLKWLMDRLERCPAQQKVLIADLCRLNPLKPGSSPVGPLPAAVAKRLDAPPAGVQVWSACSAGQHSFEERIGPGQPPFVGGAFVAALARALVPPMADPETLAKGLPIQELAAKVQESSAGLFVDKATGKLRQTPFLAGKASESAVAADPREAMPRPIAMPPRPRDAAPEAQVLALFREINLPPIGDLPGSPRIDPMALSWLPFPAEVMKRYAADRVTVEEITDKPDAYPLRRAIIKVVPELRDDGRDQLGMVIHIGEAATKAAGKERLAKMQRSAARWLQRLDDATDALEAAAGKQAQPETPRWRAHFALLHAWVLTHYVRVHEYTTAVGLIRRDVLPPLDKAKGETGWLLVPTTALHSSVEVRDRAKQAIKMYEKILRDYPNTPWALLARRELNHPLGLEWAPTTEPLPMPPPKKP